VVTAKEQVCLCGARMLGYEGELCDPKICEFARGYYDRAEDAIFELLSRQNGFTRQIISEVAKKYRVCPYELSLDLSEYCDIIICDYNYVFDPAVYFRRYFAEGAEQGRYVLLLDEAHNLADRARDMYSAELKRLEFEHIYAKTAPNDEELNEIFERIIMTLRGLKNLCRDDIVKTDDGEERGFYMSSSLPQKLVNEIDVFRQKLDAYLKKNKDSALFGELDALLSRVKRYVTVEEYFDGRFLFYIEISGGDTLVKLYCLDPSYILDTLQNRAISTVLFSATLAPVDYFIDVLG
jgi:CRISPR-associated exonuclease Cas4